MNYICQKIINRIRILGLYEALKDWSVRPLQHIYRKKFRPYVRDLTVCQTPIKLSISNFESHCWHGNSFWSGTHSQHSEIPWLKSVCKNGLIIADVGAHQGFFSILTAKWVSPGGYIHAFECLPENINILRDNLKLNRIENVQAISCAVGAKQGFVDISSDSSGVTDTSHRNGISVPMVSLDEFYSDKVKPHLIKVDVEGYELEVLKGAQNCLSSIHYLDLEFHIFNYKNPLRELEDIFDLIKIDSVNCLIELRPGMKHINFSREIFTNQKLLNYPNFHLYATWDRA